MLLIHDLKPERFSSISQYLPCNTKIISKANPNRDIISRLCLLNSSLMLMLIFTYIIIYNTQNNLNNFIVPNI